MTPIVLVEGHSDVAALTTLAAVRGLTERMRVVDMGGVTNVRRHVALLAATDPDAVVLGLCDLPERRFMERAQPALAEIFVCDRDLEDELIRALGPEPVLDVLGRLDELGRFRTFQGQPEWRHRPLAEQLRRFAGTRSGRKAVLAAALAAALTPATTPTPLRRLLDLVEG
jgi:hypothetical protein